VILRTLLCFVLLVALIGCRNNEPVKIGFVGSISGKNSDLGVAGRDGAILAVETLNAQGGINGRKSELLVKDDAQDPQNVPRVLQELIDGKAVAIVGHIASSMSKAALPIINQARVVMVSPTSSSNELSGKDDYFFRVMEPNLLFARHQAETCIKLKVKKVAAIYDLQNKTYTVDIFQAFKDEFTRLGGTISTEVTFDSAAKQQFLPLVKMLDLKNAEGLLVLANSVDAITIAQQIRKEGANLPIIFGACGIAQRDLVQQAGKSLDNIYFTVPVNSQCTTSAYTAFRDAFVKRFGNQPTMAAVLSYDATQAVIAALKRNDNPARLKETLQGMKTFSGLQGDFELDQYGDPARKLYILRYLNGREEVIQ